MISSTTVILGQFVVLCAIIPFIVAGTEGKKDINVEVNEFYEQCGKEIAARNGLVEVEAANFTSRSSSSYSRVQAQIKEEKPTNYVTPRRPESASGDRVRKKVESLAKMTPSSEMERYYCTFTKIGLLSKDGDLTTSSVKAMNCSADCQTLVSNCVNREEVKDTKALHEKAYKNVMCVYIANWLLYGFAP